MSLLGSRDRLLAQRPKPSTSLSLFIYKELLEMCPKNYRVTGRMVVALHLEHLDGKATKNGQAPSEEKNSNA